MKKTLLISVLSLAVFLSMGAALAYAQDGGANPGIDGGDNPKSVGLNFSIKNPFNEKVGNSLFGLIKAIIDNVIMPVGAVLAVLAFIYAGFKYVMAGGSETAIKEANQALLYASIGTAVLLGSWVLARVVCNTIQLLGGPACPV